MLNIPVKNPLVVQLITIAAGIAAVLVGHFAPAYSVLLSQILDVVGIGAIGVGAASFTQRKPTEPEPDDTVRIVPPTALKVPQDRSRLHNDIPDEPAECRSWRHPDWRLQLVFGVLLACVVSCSAFEKPLPCDESKLRAIDAEYSAKVIAECLPKYDTKEACPAFAGLQAEHRRQLKEACP
jgi:hypothetical protein